MKRRRLLVASVAVFLAALAITAVVAGPRVVSNLLSDEPYYHHGLSGMHFHEDVPEAGVRDAVRVDTALSANVLRAIGLGESFKPERTVPYIKLSAHETFHIGREDGTNRRVVSRRGWRLALELTLPRYFPKESLKAFDVALRHHVGLRHLRWLRQHHHCIDCIIQALIWLDVDPEAPRKTMAQELLSIMVSLKPGAARAEFVARADWLIRGRCIPNLPPTRGSWQSRTEAENAHHVERVTEALRAIVERETSKNCTSPGTLSMPQ